MGIVQHPTEWDLKTDVGMENVIHELRDSYQHLPPIRGVRDFALSNMSFTTSLPSRSVKDITEDPGTEVNVCKADLWHDAANRFPGLSVGYVGHVAFN